LEKNWLTSEQIKKLLALQRQTTYRFGELAVSSGVLTQAQVNELLKNQDLSHRVLLGDALLAHGYLSIEALETEFKEYEREEERRAAEIADAFNNLRYKPVVETFTDLLIIMFRRFANEELKIERCEIGKEKIRVFRWLFRQTICGSDIEFNCLLSVPPKVVLQMASTMLEESVTTVNDFALEASKEFVSIANNNACVRLTSSGVSFDTKPLEVYETTATPYPFDSEEAVCIHLASVNATFDMVFEF
jgi:CheY-specific phosphatase CheX